MHAAGEAFIEESVVRRELPHPKLPKIKPHIIMKCHAFSDIFRSDNFCFYNVLLSECDLCRWLIAALMRSLRGSRRIMIAWRERQTGPGRR